MNESSLQVLSLHAYIIKSCGVQDLTETAVVPHGFPHDRQFVLTLQTGDRNNGWFMDQRRHRHLARIKVAVTDRQTFRATVDGHTLEFDFHRGHPGNRQEVIFHEDQKFLADDQGNVPSNWFSDRLEIPCRLMALHSGDARQRTVQGFSDPMHVLMQDSSPVSILSMESYNALCGQMKSEGKQPPNIDVFRSGVIVVDTAGIAQPFWEDRVKELLIGGVRFVRRKAIKRCRITGINQETGEWLMDKPIPSIAKLRGVDVDDVTFGSYFIPFNLGNIRIGDKVTVMS